MSGLPVPYFDCGGVSIYNADCLSILPDLPSVDLVMTSPPYNCGKEYATGDDSMPMLEYWSMIEDVAHGSSLALKPGCYSIWNVPSWIGSREEQVFAFDEYRDILGRHIPFCDLVIWAKSPPNGTAWGNYPNAPRIRANHEWLLIHRAPGPGHAGSDISWQEWSLLTQSVWAINPILPFGDTHPATFPIEVPRRAIHLFSPAGGVILDPFAGIGTTGLAAKNLGRKAILIEKSERYCEIAAESLRQGMLF